MLRVDSGQWMAARGRIRQVATDCFQAKRPWRICAAARRPGPAVQVGPVRLFIFDRTRCSSRGEARNTVLLVGSVGSQQPISSLQLAFVLGASSASFLWFSLLGLGSHRLAPWLAQPKVWQGIEALMGLLLLGLWAWRS